MRILIPHAALAASCAALVLAALPGSAVAGNYAYFDRPDEINLNSHAGVSNDVYVRGFGWAWGDLRFRPDPGTAAPDERQARDSRDLHDAPPSHQNNDQPPRNTRGKISMS
jgi:hypothetical protein